MYRMFPKPIINTASAAVRLKMQYNADKSGNAGNVLAPSKEPLRVYGNPNQSAANKNLGLAVLAGLVIGIALMAFGKKIK